MNVPARTAAPPDPPHRGSIAIGFGLAWLTMIAGYVLMIALSSALPRSGSFLSILSLPWVVSVLLIIWLVATRRPRTAIGVAIGLVTALMIGVALFFLIVQQIANNFH
jgi:hypothetical protein